MTDSVVNKWAKWEIKIGNYSAKNARELISKMLVIDPAKRISTQHALIHSYVNMWYTRAEAEAEPREKYDPIMEESEQSVEEWMGKIK